MKITVTQEGAITSLSIAGRLDNDNAPQFRELVDQLEKQGIKDIKVDMSACEYIASAGLRVIAQLRKNTAHGGSLVFRNVCPDIMDIFQLTGFAKILAFE